MIGEVDVRARLYGTRTGSGIHPSDAHILQTVRVFVCFSAKVESGEVEQTFGFGGRLTDEVRHFHFAFVLPDAHFQDDFAAFHQFGTFLDGLTVEVLVDDVVFIRIILIFKPFHFESTRLQSSDGFA